MYKIMTPGPTQVRENVPQCKKSCLHESGSGSGILRLL